MIKLFLHCNWIKVLQLSDNSWLYLLGHQYHLLFLTNEKFYYCCLWSIRGLPDQYYDPFSQSSNFVQCKIHSSCTKMSLDVRKCYQISKTCYILFLQSKPMTSLPMINKMFFSLLKSFSNNLILIFILSLKTVITVM